MFFELWILLEGNSCSVSKTQSLDLWRGQSFIGSSHFFSPVHIVKAQYAFFKFFIFQYVASSQLPYYFLTTGANQQAAPDETRAATSPVGYY